MTYIPNHAKHLPNEVTWEQRELFGEWYQDGTGQGQYGQKCPAPYVVRMFDKMERDADRREAAERQTTADDRLTDGSSDERRVRAWRNDSDLRKARRHRRPPYIMWHDGLPTYRPHPSMDPAASDFVMSIRKNPDRSGIPTWVPDWLAIFDIIVVGMLMKLSRSKFERRHRR